MCPERCQWCWTVQLFPNCFASGHHCEVANEVALDVCVCVLVLDRYKLCLCMWVRVSSFCLLHPLQSIMYKNTLWEQMFRTGVVRISYALHVWNVNNTKGKQRGRADCKWALIKVLCLSVPFGFLLCLVELLWLRHSSLTIVMSGSRALSDSSTVNGLKCNTTCITFFLSKSFVSLRFFLHSSIFLHVLTCFAGLTV